MTKTTIPAGDDAWDDGILNTDADFTKVVDEFTRDNIDEAAGTQLVSIRMQKSMIDAFKAIASANNNIGYQTLMKQILQRFIDSEMKRVWNEHLGQLQQAGERRPGKQDETPRGKEKTRKAA